MQGCFLCTSSTVKNKHSQNGPLTTRTSEKAIFKGLQILEAETTVYQQEVLIAAF